MNNKDRKAIEFIVGNLMERVAREYFKKGQDTPKGGMAVAGDPLWRIKDQLLENYKNYIDALLIEEPKE